jgi:hypothetical protein
VSEEVRIPLLCYPHPTVNPKVIWDVASELANNPFYPEGWRFKEGEQGNLLGCIDELPILNGTPAAKLRVRWLTPSASANPWKLYVGASVVIPDTDSINPASFAVELNGTDTSGAAARLNQFDISLSTLSGIQGGRALIFRFRRDRQTPDAADTLAADVLIKSVLFVADGA